MFVADNYSRSWDRIMVQLVYKLNLIATNKVQCKGGANVNFDSCIIDHICSWNPTHFVEFKLFIILKNVRKVVPRS